MKCQVFRSQKLTILATKNKQTNERKQIELSQITNFSLQSNVDERTS